MSLKIETRIICACITCIVVLSGCTDKGKTDINKSLVDEQAATLESSITTEDSGAYNSVMTTESKLQSSEMLEDIFATLPLEDGVEIELPEILADWDEDASCATTENSIQNSGDLPELTDYPEIETKEHNVEETRQEVTETAGTQMTESTQPASEGSSIELPDDSADNEF